MEQPPTGYFSVVCITIKDEGKEGQGAGWTGRTQRIKVDSRWQSVPVCEVATEMMHRSQWGGRETILRGRSAAFPLPSHCADSAAKGDTSECNVGSSYIAESTTSLSIHNVPETVVMKNQRLQESSPLPQAWPWGIQKQYNPGHTEVEAWPVPESRGCFISFMLQSHSQETFLPPSIFIVLSFGAWL